MKYKKRKKTGEWDMFLEIWSKTKHHNCEKCNRDLGRVPAPIYFSHIVPKSKSNALRLDPNNIELLCGDCHSKYEFGTIDQIKSMNNSERMKEYLKEHNYLRWFKIWGEE